MNRPDPIPFDTHRFVKRLTQEGMPTGQAEVLAEEQVALLNSNLATRQDVAVLATKEDLAATNEKVAQCATKEDFNILRSAHFAGSSGRVHPQAGRRRTEIRLPHAEMGRLRRRFRRVDPRARCVFAGDQDILDCLTSLLAGAPGSGMLHPWENRK